ncbi:MAG: hypothetical protein ACXVZT_04750 [Terriglobales bacterium]
MSSRAEPRHLIRLRIKVAGTDERGNRFAQTAFTHDVSARGARISQVPPLLCPAAVIDVEYRGRRSPFRVVWVGGFAQNEVGLLSLEPSRRIWGTPLPGQRCTGTVPPAATRPDLRVVANTVIAGQPGRSAATQAVLPEKAKRVGYFCKDSECRKTHAFHLIPDDTVVWDIWPQKIECPVSKQRYEYWKADVRPAGYV